MKYLLIIILVLAVSLAHGQSTEFGLRSGCTYNGDLSGRTTVAYGTFNNELFFRFPTNNKWTIEVFIDYYTHRSKSGPDTMAIFEGGYSYLAISNDYMDKALDYGVRLQYHINKNTGNILQHFVGIQASLDVGHSSGQRTTVDVDSGKTWVNATKGVFRTPKIGFNYLCIYNLNPHINISTLFSFNFSTDNITIYNGGYLFPSGQPVDPHITYH